MSPVRRLDEPYQPETTAPTALAAPTAAPLTLSPTSIVGGSLQRVLQNTSAALSKQFFFGTTEGDPGTVTVTVKDSLGATISSGTAAGSGTAARTYTLDATNTALLDSLDVLWTSPTMGTLETKVEVVGGFLFSLPELAAISLGGTATIGSRFTDAQMQDMRVRVEDTLEHACGVAFVPRYDRATVVGDGTTLMRLRPYLRRIRWVTTSAYGTTTTLSAGDLTNLSLNPAGFVIGGYTWPRNSLVTVGYEHGMDSPPPRVRAAALLLAKTWIVSGPVDDRVTTMSSPDTGITAALAVPGRGGSIVGVPEVDAVINEYRLPAVA